MPRPSLQYFGRTQSLSVMLQSYTVNFSDSIELPNVIRQDRTRLRSQDEHFDKIWGDALTVCEPCDIDFTQYEENTALSVGRSSRKRKLPSKLDDSHVMETVGNISDTRSKLGFKANVYLPVLDCLLGELERRFTTSNCDILKGIQALHPASDCFADVDFVKPFAELYSADMTDLGHELHQVKRLLERLTSDDNPHHLVSFISYIQRNKHCLV